MGLGIKVEPAEVKVDGGFEVLAVAIFTSGNSDRPDTAIESFAPRVSDRVGEVGEQTREVSLQGVRRGGCRSRSDEDFP